MNQNQIDELVRNIERLQISLTRAQTELDQVRTQVINQNIREPEPQPAVVPENTPPHIGDRVRILNRVRLSGSARYSQGVEGTVIRVGRHYTFVRVPLPSRNGVERFQDIKRAPHNLERLSTTEQ